MPYCLPRVQPLSLGILKKMKKSAQNLAAKLKKAGYETYFAGGSVRDELLNTTPVDYDIATSATPEQVLKVFPKGQKIGAAFGVILLKEKNQHFEVATFRRESDYRDGRHPETVEFCQAKEDAQRRDFTVNALFADTESSKIIDYVGGQKDLEAKLIRAVGDPTERFQEDHLRLIRAIRFATTLGFEIEPQTYEAIVENAKLLSKISPERIRDEFNKILSHPQKLRGFQLLVDTGLMNSIIPEVYALQGCEQPPQWHPEGDVYQHTCLMLKMLTEDAPSDLALAVILHDIAKPATYSFDEAEQRIRFNGHDREGAIMSQKILRKLRYPNADIENISSMVARHMMFKDVQQMRLSKLRRFMSTNYFEKELELHRVDCSSSHGMLDNYEFIQNKREEFANEPLIPPPLLSGNDLIREGWAAGPELGIVLRELQSLQLENKLSDSQSALAWCHENYPPGSNSSKDS